MEIGFDRGDGGRDITINGEGRAHGIGQQGASRKRAGGRWRKHFGGEILLGKPRQYLGNLRRSGLVILKSARERLEQPTHIGKIIVTHNPRPDLFRSRLNKT
jgi:hypothetical protein